MEEKYAEDSRIGQFLFSARTFMKVIDAGYQSRLFFFFSDIFEVML